ncbi:hypothetical protein [uncultured Ferrimonas sp.]|uniref:hypothetical protein n=1 Tax=uncultured Ferrimonas sp. TaxID=432640 RepID=UPI002627FA98|nr:hypothetical protein [uncultured Ferrimonas sp.]
MPAQINAVSILLLCAALGGCSQEPSPATAAASAQSAAPSADLCQFQQGPCLRTDSQLQLTPAHAPSEQPLQMNITLPEGYHIVEARIEGRDMFMGVIPVQFNGNRATTIYGSCSSDYMVWQLFVSAENGQGQQINRVFDWLADNNR